MSAATYEFSFGMNQRVTVTALQAECQVVAVMRDVSGLQYRVVYYVNSERRDQWLFGYELEER